MNESFEILLLLLLLKGENFDHHDENYTHHTRRSYNNGTTVQQ